MFNLLQQLLQQKRLYLFLLPGIIIMLIYIYLKWTLGWFTTPEIITNDTSWIEKLRHTINESGKWILDSTYQFVTIVLLSPVMAILAEKAENHLTNNTFDGGFSRMLNDFLRTISIVSIAFLFSSIVFLTWYILAWSFNLSYLTPYIFFVIHAYFIGFSYIDYALERHRYSLRESWKYAQSNTLKLIGIGSLFSFIFIIPLFGNVIAPFLTTLIATVVWVRKNRKNDN
jgi:uncharacterized protein involved in cysteine biosynthesis